MPGAEADDHDLEPVEVSQQNGGAYQRLEILCVADVARVHDDEAVDEVVGLRAQALSRGCGVISSGSTQFGITTIRSARCALRDEPGAHRLADRDDAVGPPQVRAHDPPERSDRHWIRESPELLCRFREHVLADDDERHAEATGHRETDGADHRRVGHAEHDVRPPRDETVTEGTTRGR